MCKIARLLGMALTRTGLALLAATVFPGQMATAKEGASTEIRAATDGVQVNFSARTSREVLLFSVRVAGPDGFLFEDKVEQQHLVEWLPPSELDDGTYSWEARVITADPNAPMLDQTPDLEARAIDHWFEAEFKQTHMASGTFAVRHNKIGAVDRSGEDDEGGSVTRRVAEAILDFLVPAAHAGQSIDDWIFLVDGQQDNSSVLWLGNDSHPFWSVWHDNGDLRLHGTSDDETIMRLTQDKTILGPGEGVEIKED